MNEDFIIENGVLISYKGISKNIEIPSNVTKIARTAFQNNKYIETVNISNNVTIIQSHSFYRCNNLRSIKFGNGIIEIPTGFCKDCNALSSIEISENINTINAMAFENCISLKEINLKKVTNVGNSAFAACKTLKTVYSNNLKHIENEAFCDCINLENFNFDNVKFIQKNAFENCAFKKINLSNIRICGDDAFRTNGKLIEVILNNIEYIGAHCFSNCQNLSNVQLDNICNINEFTFFNCNSLKKIKIPNGLSNVKNIIVHCKNLEKIEINGIYSLEDINSLVGIGNISLKKIVGPNIVCEDGVVYNKDKTVLIRYLESNKNKIFNIPDNVKKILNYAIIDNEFLEEINFGNIEEIKMDTVRCDNIKKIIFNKELKRIEANAIEVKNLSYDIDLRQTRLREYNIDAICTCSPEIKVKLPNSVEKIDLTGYNSNAKVQMSKSCKANIIGDEERLVIDKTLEELIDEGKTFREASQIIKSQER